VNRPEATLVGYLVILVGLVAIGWSWWQSKRDTYEMRDLDEQYERDLKAAMEKKAKEKAGGPA
jgi:predicted negative regulator of RcsB-dependent stress response